MYVKGVVEHLTRWSVYRLFGEFNVGKAGFDDNVRFCVRALTRDARTQMPCGRCVAVAISELDLQITMKAVTAETDSIY